MCDSASAEHEITMFNVVIACVRKCALLKAYSAAPAAASYSESSNRFKTKPGVDPVSYLLGLRTTPVLIPTAALRHVLEAFTRALHHQEQRHRYVTRQVGVMIDIAEKHKSETAQNILLSELMMNESALANELRTLYHCLIGGLSVNVVINTTLTLTIPLCTPPDTVLRPYHALLPVGDYIAMKEVLSSMGCSLVNERATLSEKTRSASSSSSKLSWKFNTSGANMHYAVSPKIRQLLHVVSPLLSFSDLVPEIQEPIEQLYSIASHLCHWGVARIITPVTLDSIYQIHPDAPLGSDSMVAGGFRSCFKKYSIDTILAKFNGIKTLQIILKEMDVNDRDMLIDMVVWLLQWRMIREMYTFLTQLTEHRPLVRRMKSESSKSTFHGVLTIEEILIRDRINPYVDGTKPVCEILYLTNLTRKELMVVVAKCDDIAVTLRPIEW